MKNQKKTNQVNTVLGNSRSAPYTHAQFSKDLQVYHLTNNHHPNQVYSTINKNFVQSIEIKDNPADAYNKKMKNIYMDELDSSLNQYKNKILKMKSEADQFRKDYKQNLNGVLVYMQNQEQRRNQHLRNSLKKQEERQKRFIDADLIKNTKIQQFIRKNQFPHKLEIVRSQYESIQNKPTIQQSQYQSGAKLQERSKSINCQYASKQKYRQLESKSQYITQNSINSKNSSAIYKNPNDSKILRIHNPITNPIEYHIDNPYFIKKMQKKQGINFYNANK